MLCGDKEGIYVYEELIHLLYSRNWDNIVKHFALLMGIYIDTATLEDGMEIP